MARLSESEFEHALALTKCDPESASVRAARMHLVDGRYSMSRAGLTVGVSRQAVAYCVERIMRRARVTHCPTCGHHLVK